MKKKWMIAIIVAGLTAGTASAQQSQLPAPSPVEKTLAARASDVTEVTLSKSMLAFAARFMDNHDKDDAATRQLIENLDGIYVRSYEFDKEDSVTPEEIEQLRSYFVTSEWTPMVRERERKNHESTDVMIKQVNGETHGMFDLSVESKELTIVLILGPIKPEDLSKLKGVGGLGRLGALHGKTIETKKKGDDQ